MRDPAWTTDNIPSLEGRVAVVTDACHGIGWHIALELARAGGKVILTARSAAEGANALARIAQILPRAHVRAEILDPADLSSVRKFAALVLWEAKLDVLVNHVAVRDVPNRQTTKDGFELHLGSNFLMPFALTGLLMPVLLRALSPRVTTVSSAAAGMGMRKINFEDLQGWERYNPWRAYCQSRLAGLMFAMELARRCRTGSRRLLSNAAHPGNVFCGSKADRLSTPLKIIANGIAPFSSQEAGRGALPILRAATAPDAKPGSFYGPSRMFGLKGDPIPMCIPKSARNQLAAQKLWWTAVQLTNVSFEFPEKMLRRYK